MAESQQMIQDQINLKQSMESALELAADLNMKKHLKHSLVNHNHRHLAGKEKDGIYSEEHGIYSEKSYD